RPCALRTGLRRSTGVRQPGCRQGPSTLRCRRRRPGRCRALPAAARPARAADLRRGRRSRACKPDQAHGNMLTATALEMLGETAALLRKRGLDPARFVELMTSTMFGGRVHRIYGERIVAQDYVAGFALPLVLKDVRLALAEAESAAVPMPSVNVVKDRLMTGIARGYAELDWTALGLIAAEEAGAPVAQRAAPP